MASAKETLEKLRAADSTDTMAPRSSARAALDKLREQKTKDISTPGMFTKIARTMAPGYANMPPTGVEQSVDKFLSEFWASRPKLPEGTITKHALNLKRADGGPWYSDIPKNIAAGSAEFVPNMAGQAIEDPIGTVAGLLGFYPDVSGQVTQAAGVPKHLTESGGMFAGGDNPEVAQAREQLRRDPLNVLLAALPFLKLKTGTKPVVESVTKANKAASVANFRPDMRYPKVLEETPSETPTKPVAAPKAEAAPIVARPEIVAPERAGKSVGGQVGAAESTSAKWYRGEFKEPAQGGDKFYSASQDVAEGFGKVSELNMADFPKNPLRIDSKEALAKKIGYEGDPLAEPISNQGKFDGMAKAYAKQNGYDGIVYENGTFGAAELHAFGKATGGVEAPAVPKALDPMLDRGEISAKKYGWPHSDAELITLAKRFDSGEQLGDYLSKAMDKIPKVDQVAIIKWQYNLNIEELDNLVHNAKRGFTNIDDATLTSKSSPKSSAPGVTKRDVKPVAEPPKPKEPWEMDVGGISSIRGPLGGIKTKGSGYVDTRSNLAFRKDFVQQALSEGKPVPPGVLADYPDLAAKYGKAKPVAETSKAKEPWEMTREDWVSEQIRQFDEKHSGPGWNKAVEYRNNARRGTKSKAESEWVESNERAFVAGKPVTEKPIWGKTLREYNTEQLYESAPINKGVRAEHLESIQQALREGKPVPPEVLADYPDLAAKYGKAKPATEMKAGGITPESIAEQHGIEYQGMQEGAGKVPTTYSFKVPELDNTNINVTDLADVPKKLAAKRAQFAKNKPKESGTTLGFMGTNPEILKSIGTDAVKAARSIAASTSEIAKAVKIDPKIKKGAEKVTAQLVEHDRNIRRAESTNKLLEKLVNDHVKDADRQMLMVHAYEHKMRGPYWNKLNEIEKGVVRFMSQEKAKLNRYIEENEVLDLMKSEEVNHIFHHWINPETGKPYEAMYGKFSKGLPQAKQRIIPTYEAGVKAGLKPATTNLGKLIGLEWEAATRANINRQVFKSIHNVDSGTGNTIKLRMGGKPRSIRMVERWDLLKKQQLDDGYVRYSHPALDKEMRWVDDGGNVVRMKGAVGVRKEIYPMLKAYLESPDYGKLDKLLFATKSLKLGVSLFHPVSLAMQELANWRIPFKNIPRGLSLRRELGPEMRLLHQEGLELFKGYEDLGYRNAFFEGTTTAGQVGNAVTKPIELMRTFIFDIVQPGMKSSFAFDKFSKLLPEYLKKYNPEITLEAARAEVESGVVKTDAILRCARDVVNKADGHFSGEHYKRALLESSRFMQRVYFEPTARKWWQRILLSPTWQREHLMIAKNVAKSFMPDNMIKRLGLREIGPIKADYRRYALAGTMIVGAVDMWNYLSTREMDGEGKHIWENPPGKRFAVRAWWDEPDYTITQKDGKTRKVNGGPAYIRPLKSLFEVAEWVADPVEKFTYKLSPAVTAIGEQMFPSEYKDYEGWEAMDDRAWDFITEVTTPITVDQVIRWEQGKKSTEGTILPFFGFPVSKAKKKYGTTRESMLKRIEYLRNELIPFTKQGKPKKNKLTPEERKAYTDEIKEIQNRLKRK